MSVEPTAFFWSLADGLLEIDGVSKGTLMGFPCLRFEGAFFAMADHRTGDMIVKLTRERVADLVTSGMGHPFAPAGRTFREWVLFDDRDVERWSALLDEALTTAGGQRGS